MAQFGRAEQVPGVLAGAKVLLLLVLLSVCCTGRVNATFGQRDPPPARLLEAQAVCVSYLRICQTRLAQYNNSIYPVDRDTMCMVRCAGIMLNFWDDKEGLLIDGLANLYPALANNIPAQRQIVTCAEQRLAVCSRDDLCTRAYQAFRCFLEALDEGFTVRDPNLDVPPNGDEEDQLDGRFGAAAFRRSIETCSALLRAPLDKRELYRQGIFPKDDLTQGVIRCIGIINGLYDDETGPNLTALYRLFGMGQPEPAFRERLTLCMKANEPLLRDQNRDAKAYRFLLLCNRDAIGALIRANA
ncbi:uncharacterized protein LOC118458793 [Anopheles albimanus]|uniref:Uncharacterized protein n=1 Tax=Anopheles albimanus TaxID=7167 RepID=A0A8W7K6L4_ANOAL|nr:uncharacterized protein LOC118458793 [Anopheles albimanus]